jgi:cystathionine beta-lyase/cystathionine gamma-synthase
MQLAMWCEQQAKCNKVYYPGLASHPHHELATRQMSSFGSVFAIDIPGGIDACRTFISALQLVRPATSLGGPETLICHPATSTHFGLDEESLSGALASDGLMRISVGLEHVDDLRHDFAQAFAAIKPTQ